MKHSIKSESAKLPATARRSRVARAKAIATCGSFTTVWCAVAVVAAAALAQDIPGIEICTRETRLDRRTGCLQSNVEFLQQVVTKNALDTQQKLFAASREIAALREQVAAATREAAALRNALAAMEARIAQLEKPAPQPKQDAKK